MYRPSPTNFRFGPSSYPLLTTYIQNILIQEMLKEPNSHGILIRLFLSYLTMLHHRSFELHFADFWTSYLSIMLLYHFSKNLQLYTTARLWLKVHNHLHRKRNMNFKISASSLVTKQRFPTKMTQYHYYVWFKNI